MAVVLPLDQKVMLFDAVGRKEVAAFVSNQQWLTVASFSPDGKTLAVGGGSFHHTGRVELWDVAARRKTKELTVNTNTVRCVSFSMNGKQIIAGSTQSCRLTQAFRQGDVHRWNATTGQALAALGH